MKKKTVQAADAAMEEFENVAKGALAQMRAERRAQILEMKAKVAELERQAEAEDKAMFDTSSDPTRATTHAKIVLGAAVMALVMLNNAAEGSLAHQIRTYLDKSMVRNADRKLFGLRPITTDESKTIRAQRQSYISAMLDSSKEQGDKLYADKNCTVTKQATDLINTERQTTIFDAIEEDEDNDASNQRTL